MPNSRNSLRHIHIYINKWMLSKEQFKMICIRKAKKFYNHLNADGHWLLLFIVSHVLSPDCLDQESAQQNENLHRVIQRMKNYWRSESKFVLISSNLDKQCLIHSYKLDKNIRIYNLFIIERLYRKENLELKTKEELN